MTTPPGSGRADGFAGGDRAVGYSVWFWKQQTRPGMAHYLKGMDDSAAHHYHQAEQEWLLGVKEDPASPQCYESLGDLYGGDFFCDSGGLWMTTTPDGKLVFTRLGPGATWKTACGKTTIPLNQWTLLQFTWDGQTSRIFVSGVLDGQADAPPQFSSGRRALGCNPFGHGSGYYNGDIDSVEIKALEK